MLYGWQHYFAILSIFLYKILLASQQDGIAYSPYKLSSHNNIITIYSINIMVGHTLVDRIIK